MLAESRIEQQAYFVKERCLRKRSTNPCVRGSLALTAGEQLDSSASSEGWWQLKQNDFLATLFTASLAFEAILFGVFGIFYSVYALYASLPTKKESAICKDLRRLCQVLSALGTALLAPVLIPLWELMPPSHLDETLSGILATASGAMVVVTLTIAFKYM